MPLDGEALVRRARRSAGRGRGAPRSSPRGGRGCRGRRRPTGRPAGRPPRTTVAFASSSSIGPRYRPGRRTGARVPRTAAQTTTVRASGSTRTSRSRARPTPSPSRQTASGGSRIERSGRRPTGRSAGPGGAGGCRCGPAGGPRGGHPGGRVPSVMSSRPSPGCARGPRSQSPSHSAFMTTTDPAPPPRAAGDQVGDELVRGGRRAGRTPRSTGKVMASAVGSRASSPVPPRVRHRSPPSSPRGGGGRRPGGPRSTTAAGLGVGADHHAVGRQGAGLAAGAAPSRWSRCGVLRRTVDPRSTPPAVSSVRPRRCRRPGRSPSDGRRRRDHAAVDGVGGRRAVAAGGRVRARRRRAGAAGRCSCLIVADEVAAGELLVVEDVVEVVAGRPGVGQGEEARVGHAGRREPERAARRR